MEKIEALRNSLYTAITKGDQKEILTLSKRLDKLIVGFMKEESQGKLVLKSRSEKHQGLLIKC